MGAALAKKQSKQPEYELLSIQKIAFRCGLDRATCRKRLDAHGYEPETDEAKLKLYRFDSEMEAALTEVNDKLGEVRIRKETAEAELREAKVLQIRGELVQKAEVTDMVQRLFGAMHKEIAVRMPKEIAGKLAKAKTAPQAAAVIKSATDKRFKILRDDFEKYLT